jgi:lipoprotein-anchoring transpeptidase ErfK/SrfK
VEFVMPPHTRRVFALGAISVGLSGCAGSGRSFDLSSAVPDWMPFGRGERASAGARADYARIYGPVATEPFPVKPFRYARIDPAFLRQQVAYTGGEAPGTIVVDPNARFLYRVEAGGRATRYGVGVGREGFAWSGDAQINMKRTWPDWIPPHAMVERDPDIRSQLEKTPRGTGVAGGPRSPLGARAMYLFANGDTGYRIHGTTEPETIGTAVSSGCVRMVNQDIIDLYARTPDGTKVVVLSA